MLDNSRTNDESNETEQMLLLSAFAEAHFERYKKYEKSTLEEQKIRADARKIRERPS